MVKLPTRIDIPLQEKWNLLDLFSSMEEWEHDYLEVADITSRLHSYDGRIINGKTLYEFLSLKEQMSYIFSKVYAFSMLQLDEDTSNPVSQALLDRSKSLSIKVSSATAFFMPYLLTLNEQTLRQYIAEEPALEYFEDDLFEAYRYKAHVLTKEQEELLSRLSEAISVPSTTFGMLNNADIKFGDITNNDGKQIELTRGMYAKLIEDEDRQKRHDAYKAYYQPYLQLKNTIATTLSSAIKNNVTVAKIRNYPNALKKSLFSDNVPDDVYHNLIMSTKENVHTLHRYTELRKRHLKLDELRAYDMSVPLVNELNWEIPYNEAYDIMLRAIQPLGDEYVSILKIFKDSRYLDVRETKGKRSGAYNLGVYGVHPYILLNHRDDIDSLFTLVHECGHGVHSYLSSKHQPQISARYSILVAEVASTVNEVLLIHYLLKTEKGLNKRKYLLNQFIDQFKGTFFTQVMFSEFEKKTHELAEQGIPLNVDVFNNIYEDLFREYNGHELVFDEEVKYGWTRIPHFYRPFYVYKYATGFVSAIQIATKILSGDQSMLIHYQQFLKSGSSDYPLELLKKTGVDLTSPEPIEAAMKTFSELVSELDGLLTSRQ